MAGQRFPLVSTEKVPERALLVGIDRPGNTWSIDQTLAELERLVHTAGAHTIAVTTQKLDTVNPRTFVGTGKADEIAHICRMQSIDVVVFDDELSPSQQSNLEKIVDRNVKIIDRTALILDIFALHATTKEGCLQVRLAQNQYLYPRLRGMWQHLASNRMGGGVGSRFGEGESQLEIDRRMVRKRITQIKRELKVLEKNRTTQRAKRSASGMLQVALAGYTNAGKSSLLNQLCHTEVLTYDKLFATLDSTTRKYVLPEGREIVLTDTVGFIQKLPTTLIEAFKSTLDEIRDADIILHVVDASSESFESQINAVEDVLGQIGAVDINRIEVFNKIDLLEENQRNSLQRRFKTAVFVSAATGENTDVLIDRIATVASAQDSLLDVLIPYQDGNIVALAHEQCSILHEEHHADGTYLQLRVPHRLEPHFSAYVREP